jgi:uncharacterized NAD(P)/FAD-binding protein YdhS
LADHVAEFMKTMPACLLIAQAQGSGDVEEPDPRDFRGWLRRDAERPHEDAKGRGMKSLIRRRGMIASWVHGRVGAFYAPDAREETQILQIKTEFVIDD